jgi:hypothetical protein
MPNKLAHFAIEAEDVERALKFYESVFGWRFSPWGPPEFYLIEGEGAMNALLRFSISTPLASRLKRLAVDLSDQSTRSRRYASFASSQTPKAMKRSYANTRPID